MADKPLIEKPSNDKSPTGKSPREILVNQAFKHWFNSRYKELISAELLQKWQFLDTLVQIGIALTASGSAIAGWQLWESPTMKAVWAILSGVVSIIALSHKTFGVTSKIQTWTESNKAFGMIRNQLEILKYEVDMSSCEQESDETKKNFDETKKNFDEILRTYSQENQNIPDKDFFIGPSLENKVHHQIYYSIEITPYEQELARSRQKLEEIEKQQQKKV